MKKIVSLFLIIFTLTFIVNGAPINPDIAKTVGQNFLKTRVLSKTFLNNAEVDLVYTVSSNASNNSAQTNATNYFYVFNINSNQGFVIVSADDQANPILAYSAEKPFDPNKIPINVAKWLESYKNEIRYIITNNILQTDEIANNWSSLINGINYSGGLGKKAGVTPLCQTTWDQSPYYNTLCPYDNSASERTVTGCVATAMAQVMKFWNFPATGTGYHSYNHDTYGTLSANFGSSTYNWTSMPNNVSSSNSAVATLMYHCGVSVDMNYGVGSTGGSGAYVISNASPVTNCTEYALKNYFGYKSTLQGVERDNYTQTQWINLMKTELDAGRPVIYAGFGSGGGHCFVNDGYDNNSFFHFNWGWSGSYDGFFSINSLNPGGVGTGGGSGGFNNNHQAVIGIEPSSGTSAPSYDMRLYAIITVNPDPITYNSGFTVTVNVANYGTSATNNFAGDYAAAIFNANNEFIQNIEVKTGYSLNFNSYYTNPLVFTTTSISALTPGNYSIGIYYKPTGASQWTAFANGNYQNFKQIQVEGNNTNPLKLYAALTTTPTIITRNQTFTINFDVANFSTSSFDGEISVDIHKSDGTWIRELSSKTSLSLPTNTHFTNGLTYTITGGIADSAGTYQLFVWDKPTGGDWEFLGNGTFSNPITFQVKDPDLVADIYEVNNTLAQAYNLPLTFTNNIAKKETTGSNCHLGNDYDYYKIVLPAGNDYSTNARLQDENSANNGKTYTLDALFSYSLDGTLWSDAFDDVLPSNIQVTNGGTLYFKISPFFTGSTGSYILDLSITRTPIVSSSKDITSFSVPGMVGGAIINTSNSTVTAVVNSSTNINSLVPTITVSSAASINPNSGIPQNFANPFNYTATAQDNSSKVWTVIITKQGGTNLNEFSYQTQIKVYPNPSKEIVNIDVLDFKGQINKIQLTDLQGKIITNIDVKANTLVYQYQLNSLADGLYFLNIDTDKGIINKKIMVSK